VSRIFGPVRQMAYLVQDIESSMRDWTKLMGVGPFFYLKYHSPTGATFRGQPTNMCISLAFAQSGPIQIELVQQINDGPSLFKEFLDSGREGLHHIAFWTEQFDQDMARYQGAGYKAVQTAKLGGPNHRNAFIEASGPTDSAFRLKFRKSTAPRANSSARLQPPRGGGPAVMRSAKSAPARASTPAGLWSEFHQIAAF
jgi:Glyoxalase/Bleomycin resistance protein/Dioxygenase superfamily